jgi:hypothetical protein
MSRAFVGLMPSLCVAAYCTIASAQQFPKSGTFAVESGWKAIGETIQVAQGRTYGSGNLWGVVFNAKGSGPLHWGSGVCPYTLEIISGTLTAHGECSWNDSHGDKIFTDWTGSMPPNAPFEGLHKITGGTGKFNGITGKAQFHCKALNSSGQYACAQEFHYRLE